ncbi:MAG: hypothetical protein IKT00_09060 [Prevotella sp.]|nr:hypothetical protein [Prevotella sp.]
MKHLKNHMKLSAEQKQEIQDFYKKTIGRKIDLYSHEYFYSRTGVYSKFYIPTNFYMVELVGRANRWPFIPSYGDKNITDKLLSGIKMPHTILKCMNGHYYFEGEPVSEQEALDRCKNLSDVLIKPALSSQGKGIQSVTVKDGTTNIDGLSLKELFRQYRKNFLLQERLHQHERMDALNPTSVNTIRIVTYRSDMEILLVYAVVRIGKMGSVVDNQCAGGISAVIDENGCLGKFGFGGYEEDNILKTDAGTFLEGYQLPSYDKAIETVKKLHFQLPYFDLIGWDIAIDVEGDPVLIEWNQRVGLSQSAYGPGFGKYTERILKELWPKKNTFR